MTAGITAETSFASTLVSSGGWARELLSGAIHFQSLSGQEAAFTRWLAGQATSAGLSADLWESSEADLEPIAGPLPRHIPLAGRPTLVIRLAGRGGGRSLTFNAHSDVVAAPGPERWRFDPWSGREQDGLIYGRGACDTKGPLVAALWAMRSLAGSSAGLAGDVLLEVVPGEEDCVGLGTLTSIARGYHADAAVVLEPTQNRPRCASRAGCRFTITAHGRAVHGTAKWLGRDAIAIARAVHGALEEIERGWVCDSDPLFDGYPIARPITVDQIRGGEWQGMVCDRCELAGYLELLPLDDLGTGRRTFEQKLRAALNARGVDPSWIEVAYTEEYLGHRLEPESPLCHAAEEVLAESGERAPCIGWLGTGGFNSGCEAGARASICGTPTLVWGPGDLAHAHAVDEHVRWEDVERAARLFGSLAERWCGAKECL